MFERRFRLPSPALVISMVALSLVLGGTAVAATATHGDKKADTKLIKKLAPTLSVKHAKSANSATNAVNATTAANATHATSADSATNATNATNATHADTATNATTVGGKKVQQFFSSLPTGTGTTTIASVDGVTLKASCDGGNNPHLSIENDSGQGAYLGGYSSSSSTNLNNGTFTSTPVDLSGGGTNGGGVLTVELANGQVVSVQFAGTGFLGGTGLQCRFGGSIIAS
jgi:hypothetical protein